MANSDEISLIEIESRNKMVADALGEEAVADALIEECSELIQAICKYKRAKGIGQPTNVSEKDAMDNLIVEIADVKAALMMYMHCLDFVDEDLIPIFDLKSARSLDRIQK